MNIRNFNTVKERRKALENELKVDLKNIGHFSLDESVASTRNCENMIGVAQIPMGVAGPLQIKSQNSNHNDQHGKKYYIPLATTEGALVASVNRGCKAISESGGATVDSYRVGVTRGAVFHVSGLAENDKLNTFLEDNFKELQSIARQSSSHLTLTKFFSRGLGRHRYVRFVFDTEDAMGMNMATIASTSLCKYIETKIDVRCISVAGNYDVDKKPSWLSIIEGRGSKVWAEVILPSSVLRDILKTSAQQIYDVWLAKCMLGSAMSGSMGFNAQYANVVAGIFLATGQDIGHVAEGSMGITTVEKVKSHPPSLKLRRARKSKVKSEDEDLYVSIYLPDLMVGTVGGGTGLATQKEALSMLGVAGGSRAGEEGKHAQRFAEIIAGAVLAGEISLLASLSIGTLAKSHQTLARGKS